jgi:hypothetical protein
MNTGYVFKLMYHMFWGFGLALIYGIVTALTTFLFDRSEFDAYLKMYFISFNSLVSGGLIIGTAIFVFLTQKTIPEFVERSFEHRDLEDTAFVDWKRNYLSTYMTLRFSTLFAIIGFGIFYLCKFPLKGSPEHFMIFFGCLQYALGVYVGRKLFNIANILDSIANVKITRNIFKEDELGYITNYVNILSTLTILLVFVHVKSYYEGPFEYSSFFGLSPKPALLLPAVIATPVLVIFNFYPRISLKRLYSRSISQDVDRLTDNLKNDNLSEFERLSYLIEYDRLAREDLANKFRLSVNDLPIGITIFVMLIGLLSKL